MKIEIESNIDLEEFNDFIQSNQNATFYHTKKHICFLSDILKLDPYFVTVRQNNSLLGTLPFFVKNGKHGKVVNSLPFFGSYGGMICLTDCQKPILECMNFFNKENDVLSSTIIDNPFFPNDKFYDKYYNFTIKENKKAQCLKLANKSDNMVWNDFEQRVRRAVRKSQKLDIKVTTTSLTDEIISEFYKMHKSEIESKNGKIKPIDFFYIVRKNFIADIDYNVYVAKQNNENISFLLVFYDKQFAEYYMPAYDTNKKYTQSTSLLIWESIQNSIKRNIQFYNFGGTWKNQHELYRFKRGWNSSDFYYNYYIYCNLDIIKKIEFNELLTNYDYFYIVPFNKIS